MLVPNKFKSGNSTSSTFSWYRYSKREERDFAAMRRSSRKWRDCESITRSRCRSFDVDYCWIWRWGSSTTQARNSWKQQSTTARPRKRRRNLHQTRLQREEIWGKVQETTTLCGSERTQKQCQNPSQCWRQRFDYNVSQTLYITLRLKIMKTYFNCS